MNSHNAKAIAAAVAIAAATAAASTDPEKESESKQSLTALVLYVDVATKMPNTENTPSPPPDFTLLREDFPALPGVEDDLSTAPESTDWPAIISDDDPEQVEQAVSVPKADPVNLQGNGNSQSGKHEALKTKPFAVARVAATTEVYSPGCNESEPNFIGEWERAGNKPRKSNIGPPPGYEKFKFYGRLKTNRIGLPLGGVTFDVTPPLINKDMPPQVNTSIEGAYGLVELARNLEAAQHNRQLLSQFFGHDTMNLNVNANCWLNQLHAGFAGPLQGGRCAPHEINSSVPHYYYRTDGKQLPQPKIDQMQVELLFFFFYSYPGDMMQMLAAAELAERGWRFHIYERLWLRRQPDNPHYVMNGYQESGEFNYFNMVHWQIMARHFDLKSEDLEPTITKAELRKNYGYHPQMSFL
ncbi:uncharacterized protein LOC6566930 isoform X2 [Drosophila grimshawi]|uniref:uncharacterized protein LOC6566930 isoform X2 n=1 Tax=Drosophila grimshawi TaxID=7222 RepID=UPI000C870E4E|nr:uncharacterized protein LOC6566930 isoform X2 [Drosophila grimshawi]